jgi:hypothetical protein
VKLVSPLEAGGGAGAVTREERITLGQKRLLSVLRRHVVAPMRTLEQKISDAGPNNQRIDPHLLTISLRRLLESGEVVRLRRNNKPWYHLNGCDPAELEQRLGVLGLIHDRTSTQDFGMRSGQTLEIAVYRALSAQNTTPFLGGYPDLLAHDDSTLYTKEEPPRLISGRALPGAMRLDFIIMDPVSGVGGIEVKNVREWLYPDREEVADLLRKCCHIHAIPILIARRIAYSTFSVLHTCGVLVHQTFNQLYPEADADLAVLARDKNLLGYHDVRVGNLPDPRLLTFLHHNLPALLPAARERFSRYFDLLSKYGEGVISYPEFAWRVRRREAGESEDRPLPPEWEVPF